MGNLLKYHSTNINFTDTGKGKVLVLLHGFLGSLEVWNYFAEVLHHEFRIITIDLPGHGKTGNISNIHSMEVMADTVKYVLDFLKIDKCTMIGHSMGGSVTLAFAEMYPERLSAFGLFHSTAYDDSPEVKISRDKMIQAVSMDHKDFIYQFIPGLFPSDRIDLFKEEIKILQKMASGMSKESIIALSSPAPYAKTANTLLINGLISFGEPLEIFESPTVVITSGSKLCLII